MPGEIGDLNNFNYQNRSYRSSCAQASQFEYASNRLVERYNLGVFILKLRKSLKDQEWNNVEAILNNVDAKKMDTVYDEEIERARSEYENHMIIDSCTKAIEVGKVTGTVENPVLENVSADKIHKALDSTKGMLRITSSASVDLCMHDA